MLRDARLIYAAALLRSAVVGLVGVLLAIHLARAGFSPQRVGLIIGAGVIGAAIATIAASLYTDRWGRRRTLAVLALASAFGFSAPGVIADPNWMLIAAFAGMLNGMGRDRGAASALEQAILPQAATPARRTWMLAGYNVTIDAGHALGALAAVTPSLLITSGLSTLESAHTLTFVACGAVLAACAGLYALLTDRVEAPVPSGAGRTPLTPESRRVITRLALLFGIDSIGGGFLSSALIGYWFFTRYGASETTIALLFFCARILNAVSHLGAAWLAGRIGLLNTMVWTHLPSSVFLMLAPMAPTLPAAALLFLAREALVEMDVPTRQSYVLAVVAPSERVIASGITNVTRHLAWSVGPMIAGGMISVVPSAPLVVGGALKIAYDLLLYRSFRHVRPPEESPA